MKREGNDPKRRVTRAEFSVDRRKELAAAIKYVGSPHHKRFLSDYGFDKVEPRADKTLCDGIRKIPKNEAKDLVTKGVMKGLFSDISEKGFPKYVWSVDADGVPYEAKTDPKNPGEYHGYPFREGDPFGDVVRSKWAQR